jgi:hypothetical protein
MSIPTELIKQAYAIQEAMKIFNNLGKNDILDLYTELDCVYSWLEKLGIVSIYSKNAILINFEVKTYNITGNRYIHNEIGAVEIDVEAIINELTKMYTK